MTTETSRLTFSFITEDGILSQSFDIKNIQNTSFQDILGIFYTSDVVFRKFLPQNPDSLFFAPLIKQDVMLSRTNTLQVTVSLYETHNFILRSKFSLNVRIVKSDMSSVVESKIIHVNWSQISQIEAGLLVDSFFIPNLDAQDQIIDQGYNIRIHGKSRNIDTLKILGTDETLEQYLINLIDNAQVPQVSLVLKGQIIGLDRNQMVLVSTALMSLLVTMLSVWNSSSGDNLDFTSFSSSMWTQVLMTFNTIYQTMSGNALYSEETSDFISAVITQVTQENMTVRQMTSFNDDDHNLMPSILN